MFSNHIAESDDYTLPDPFGVTFLEGSSATTLCTLPIKIIDDEEVEGEERFIVAADPSQCLKTPLPIISVRILDNVTTGKRIKLLRKLQDCCYYSEASTLSMVCRKVSFVCLCS